MSPLKDGQGAKRQRISLKLNGGKAEKGRKGAKEEAGAVVEEEDVVLEQEEGDAPDIEGEVDAEGEDDVEVDGAVKEGDVDVQEEVVNALGRDVRDALAVVLAQ